MYSESVICFVSFVVFAFIYYTASIEGHNNVVAGMTFCICICTLCLVWSVVAFVAVIVRPLLLLSLLHLLLVILLFVVVGGAFVVYYIVAVAVVAT